MLGGMGLTVGESCGTAPGLQPCTNLPSSATAACGINPCGFWDNVFISDSCLTYQQCLDPGNASTILESQGLIAGGGTVVGTAIAQGISNLFNPENPDGTNSLNWVTIALAGIGVVIALKVL